MKIECDIGAEAARFLSPTQEIEGGAGAAKVSARENVDVIDVAIAAQERRPFGIDDPGDLCGRVSVADGGDGRQGVNDIAEGAWLDDENGFQKSKSKSKRKRKRKRKRD